MNVESVSSREHRQSAIIGILLAMAVYIAGSFAWQQWRFLTPASYWFEVQGIFIADAEEGQDPVVTYTRTMHVDVNVDYTVTLSRHEGPLDTVGVIACEGEGEANFVAGRELPPAATSLAWLMNREDHPCVLTPGIYRARAVWNLHPDGFPMKQVTADSNYFTVHPRK